MFVFYRSKSRSGPGELEGSLEGQKPAMPMIFARFLSPTELPGHFKRLKPDLRVVGCCAGTVLIFVQAFFVDRAPTTTFSLLEVCVTRTHVILSKWHQKMLK